MPSFATFGNDLYTGARSYDIVGRRRLWYTIAIVTVAASVILLLTRGLNAGIEFRGGSQFTISGVAHPSTGPAGEAVASTVPDAGTPEVTTVGAHGVRVATDKLTSAQSEEVADALATAYDVSDGDVTTTFVGATWGSDITTKALQSLVIFLVIAALVLAAYFRTWKMSAAALIALVHDVVLTAGVYALTGFEVTPATVIGFLTILGYSLYDTVVVFDKVRENTAHIKVSTTRTFAEAANLAVNQTLVRSINTSVVALLPVASILFVGALLLGAGTLKDISVALFVGILAGAYSSIFIATPLYSQLVEGEDEVRRQRDRVLARRRAGKQAEQSAHAAYGVVEGAEPVGVGAGLAATSRATTGATTGSTTGSTRSVATGSSRAIPPGASRGPRNQPSRRSSRSGRRR